MKKSFNYNTEFNKWWKLNKFEFANVNQAYLKKQVYKAFCAGALVTLNYIGD